MNFFDMLDEAAGKKQPVIKAPFGWPGGKSKTVKWLVDLIPRSEAFVDVFGGSGVVMLNMPAGKNDVFNDINSGVCSLYRCLRNPIKLQGLIAWIENTVHSYEEWVFCKESWQDVNDDIERAGRWLYMVQYSFAGQGRAYGFARGGNAFSGKLLAKISAFGPVHNRFKHVNVENAPWQKILDRYDAKGTVFYLDPPYPDSDMSACYGKNVMGWDAQREMLERIQTLKGQVVLSGYANKLYDSYEWSERHTKETNVSTPKTEHGHVKAEEVVWIRN